MAAARLISYCLANDDGSAPNPYAGICTLALCKPAVRKSVMVGDWVAGTGAKRTPAGDFSGKLVYAMRVSAKLPMSEYDAYVAQHAPDKMPDAANADWRRRLGDAIYDHAGAMPVQRAGVRGAAEMARDLSGGYVLIAEEFWYFGREAVPLPAPLRDLAQQQQGHRSALNAPLLEPFAAWVRSLGKPGVFGDPQIAPRAPR